MPELKTPPLSKRAERAVTRATRDQKARLAAGLVVGSGAAIVATKVAHDHVREDTDDGQSRTYRLRRKESLSSESCTHTSCDAFPTQSERCIETGDVLFKHLLE